MAIPKQPDFFLTQPFASEGQYMLPPAVQQLPGRFSQAIGFPVETAKPENEGGLAPERMDFNGALLVLSAFTHWQQSGGLFVYNQTLNYGPPAMIVWSGNLWWCVAQNGPETDAGVKEPGTDTDYWVDFLTYMSEVSGVSLGGWQVGDIKMHWGETAPEGFFEMNGDPFDPIQYPKLFAHLGSSILPDIAGCVPRASDPTAKRDPDGATRAIGSIQGDACRNITGTISSTYNRHPLFEGGAIADGAFDLVRGTGSNASDTGSDPSITMQIRFDASRSVPTAPENRGTNFSALFCIKHD